MPHSTNDPEVPDLKENDHAEPQVRLSRSPHPYHRQPLNRETVNCRFRSDLATKKEQVPDNQLARAYTKDRYNELRSESSEFLYGRQRKASSSPSESGTEADDEGVGLLKGLPAPPPRLHKGLKESATFGSRSNLSPLLTPSHIDDDGRRLFSEPPTSSDRRGPKSTEDGELRRLRERLAQKRRGEYTRRAVEVILVLIVGAISWPWTGLESAPDTSIHPESGQSGNAVLYENTVLDQLGLYGLVLGAIYASCLVRVLWHHFDRSSPLSSFSSIRIAASFDPAPFLYPIVIPTFVAASMFRLRPQFLLSNLVLSISSIPPSMIPFSKYPPNLIQPLLALLPLLNSTHPNSRAPENNALLALSFATQQTDMENLAILPFLHQSLVPSIDFLTTTSLLPAELQLLSTSLINLLIFSKSPQAIILKALLWIGGVALYVTCRHVMKWVVAISRIPSWRFRLSYHPSTKRATLLTAIDDCLGGRLERWPRFRALDESSDEENPETTRFSRRPRKHTPAMSLSTFLKMKEPSLGLRKVLTNASMDSGLPITTQLDGHTTPFETIAPRQRRHTLPTSLQVLPKANYITKSKSSSRGRGKNTRPTIFLSLSRAQAEVLKWIYAGYVYTVVAAVIALPVHWYIRNRALSGNEPVGWALGYLFGNLHSFRLWTIMGNLERWICLPCREDSLPNQAFAEQIFIDQLGTANTRLLISAYCVIVIIFGLVAVLSLSPVAEVDTRRKVFHGMMVAMFLPAIFVDPTFAALALELILAIFLLLDLFRSSQLPPISKPLTYFLAPYVDGRDHRGPVIVSHIFLLIGCSIPLWLSLATTERTGNGAFQGWDVATRDLGMIAGVVCVGMGDAAASLFGRRYGRHRWSWSGGKSIEGSAAFAVAVILGLAMARLWLLIGEWKGDSGDSWALTMGKALIAASGASLTEAVLTGGNDNVIVPVVLWLLVRGLQM